MAGTDDPLRTDDPGAPTTDRARERERGSKQRGGSVFAKENRRLVLGAVVGALVAIFAVLNLDQVDVNWIFGTFETPLILVIAVSFVLGALIGWIADAARRRR